MTGVAITLLVKDEGFSEKGTLHYLDIGDKLSKKEKIEKLWGDKKLCDEYSKNCKDISFDTIDEYYEKIMRVYQ